MHQPSEQEYDALLEASLAGEEQAVGTHELERIPLDWIVARRNDDPPGGVVMLDGELSGGCGDQSALDHGCPNRSQARSHGIGEHRARRSGIPRNDDSRRVISHELPERCRISCDDFRDQVLPDEAPYSGDAPHQGVTHWGKANAPCPLKQQ